MARDVADVLGEAIGKVAREAAKNVSFNGHHKSSSAKLADRVNDAVSGKMKDVSPSSKGLAAGVGLATVVPLAAKGASKLARSVTSNGADAVKDAVGGKIDEAGGAPGIAKEAAKGMLPGGGGKKGKGMPGVGKGRRMPVQQDIDIGMPIATVFEKWTDYEEWPKFMHRLQSVSQEDDEHVKFKTKIWGISKEFTAEIVDERENERIKWRVTDGVTHTGVMTFHELGPRLTRIELNLDVQPGSLIEKAARGMRHVKRAVRADMARFKAYVLMGDEDENEESGESSESSERESRPRTARKQSRGGRKQSSSGRASSSPRKSASARKSSSSARKQSSSNGRSRTRAQSSSNGRSRSGAAKKRTAARS